MVNDSFSCSSSNSHVDYNFSQSSNSVSVDLLTYGDLESLRKQQHHRTGFGTQHIPGAKTRSQLHSKRYLIMTYTVEFDRLAIGNLNV